MDIQIEYKCLSPIFNFFKIKFNLLFCNHSHIEHDDVRHKNSYYYLHPRLIEAKRETEECLKIKSDTDISATAIGLIIVYLRPSSMCQRGFHDFIFLFQFFHLLSKLLQFSIYRLIFYNFCNCFIFLFSIL